MIQKLTCGKTFKSHVNILAQNILWINMENTGAEGMLKKCVFDESSTWLRELFLCSFYCILGTSFIQQMALNSYHILGCNGVVWRKLWFWYQRVDSLLGERRVNQWFLCWIGVQAVLNSNCYSATHWPGDTLGDFTSQSLSLVLQMQKLTSVHFKGLLVGLNETLPAEHSHRTWCITDTHTIWLVLWRLRGDLVEEKSLEE